MSDRTPTKQIFDRLEIWCLHTFERLHLQPRRISVNFPSRNDKLYMEYVFSLFLSFQFVGKLPLLFISSALFELKKEQPLYAIIQDLSFTKLNSSSLACLSFIWSRIMCHDIGLNKSHLKLTRLMWYWVWDTLVFDRIRVNGDSTLWARFHYCQ